MVTERVACWDDERTNVEIDTMTTFMMTDCKTIAWHGIRREKSKTWWL